jgi:hemoglobin-like flavoprotein
MTPHQIKLIQESFATIAPVADRAAENFYARLFETAPQLRPLFKGEIGAQGRKFMATLTVAVSGLENFEKLKPGLEALARQHARYGVRPEYFAPLNEALIWTLGETLGKDFTIEMREAWREACAAMAETMKAAIRAEQ